MLCYHYISSVSPLILQALILSITFAFTSTASGQIELLDMQVLPVVDNEVTLKLNFSEPVPIPRSFSIDNPTASFL